MAKCLRCGAGNEWIEPIGKETACPSCARLEEALRKAEAERDQLRRERDDAILERHEAPGVKTTEGLTASEWVLRTGKAEKERDAAAARAERAEKLLEHAITYIAPAKDFGPMMEGACSVCNATISKFECESAFLCSECLTRKIESHLKGEPHEPR